MQFNMRNKKVKAKHFIVNICTEGKRRTGQNTIPLNGHHFRNGILLTKQFSWKVFTREKRWNVKKQNKKYNN